MPTTSSFFSSTTGHTGEINLFDDLCREQIKLFGLDIMYLPRQLFNLDMFLHESTKSVFDIALPMPVYIKSFSGYSNVELLSKFGVRASDELTFICSKSEFITYYSPYLRGYYQNMSEEDKETYEYKEYLQGLTDQRPREGDLIYFPLDDGIFEIKYVLPDEPFFQLGRGYTFEMQCEKFEYSGETFDTSIEQIDELENRQEYYRLEFDLEPDGINTFDPKERVFIYDMSDEGPQGPQGYTLQEFRFYEDAGFLHGVQHVTARVMEWNKPQNRLVVGDLSDADPTQRNEDLETSRDKLDNVLIIGEDSKAIYRSIFAGPTKQATNDDEEMQVEVERIKIVDEGDEHLFGFI